MSNDGFFLCGTNTMTTVCMPVVIGWYTLQILNRETLKLTFLERI